MTMMLKSLENLRSFVQSRPPLVVFMVSMGMVAVVLVSVSYYIKCREKMSDADISEDWNAFLESVTGLNFCIVGNGSSQSALSTKSPITAYHMAHPTTTIHTTDMDPPRNHSVSMLLEFQPTPEFLAIPHNVTYLTGSVSGRHLGLSGMAADEQINISATLPYEWNNTKCVLGQSCDKVHILTCVQFTASPLLLSSSRSPPVCENLNETGIGYNVRMEAVGPVSASNAYSCQDHPFLHLQYRLGPSITMLLSLHDRSVVNLHLMHTSYFLFVMVIMLLCYAVIRGHTVKAKQMDKVYLNVPTQP